MNKEQIEKLIAELRARALQSASDADNSNSHDDKEYFRGESRAYESAAKLIIKHWNINFDQINKTE